MNISTDTIIKKIKSETDKLSSVNGDAGMAHDYMRNIHLLSELWLEAYQDGGIAKKDNKQMEKSDVHQTDLQDSNSKDTNLTDQDTSIFDF